MSISQNFPSSRPSLNLNFARSKKLDPRITFTRTSTATYVDEDGLVKSAATDTPRFEHNPSTGESLGLLIEESRTNIRTYSGIPSANWTANNSAVVTNNSSTSPDGTANATQIAGAAQIASGVYQTHSLTSGTVYTYSLFVKAVSGSNTIYFGSDTGTSATVQVNTSTGVAVSNSGATVSNITSTSYPNGWYRIAFTFTASATATHSFVIYNYTANLNTWLAWGAQVEAGSFATSYIPTVASTVTRSTDYASITGTNFSGFYNPSEGTIYCNANNISGTGSQNRLFYQFVNSSSENTDFIRQWIWTGNTNLLFNSVYTSGSIIADFSTTLTTNFKKTSFAYRVNDFAVSYNGSSPSTDTSGNLPSGINRLIIGNNSVVGGTALSGYISQLIYYPVRLPNAQLQNLTK